MPYKNPLELKLRHKRYYLANRVMALQYRETYYRDNKPSILRDMWASRRLWRFQLLQIVGLQCACCGLEEFFILQFHHVHGNGKQEFRYRFKRDSLAFYKHYVSHPEEARINLQALCPNCNFRKRYEDSNGSIREPDSPSAKARRQLIEYLGCKCVNCGMSDILVLQLDHILDGGTKERDSLGGNNMMYRYYLSNLEQARCKLQVLCATCNALKLFKNMIGVVTRG